MSTNGFKVLTLIVASVGAWYGGIKFWQPIIVEHLRETGNLRDDVVVTEIDQPKSLDDLKKSIRATIHPEQYSLAADVDVDASRNLKS